MGTESWILTLSIVLFVAFVAAGFLADSFPLQPWIRTLRRWIRFAFFSLALALAAKKYFFTDETELEKFKTEDRLIEERAYNTVYGIWHYFTADDGQFNFEQKNQDYLMIGTLESYEKLKTYFGNEKVVPLYIEVEDGERLTRALAREKTQKEPKYAEMCRRFLADSKDFSEEL